MDTLGSRGRDVWITAIPVGVLVVYALVLTGSTGDLWTVMDVGFHRLLASLYDLAAYLH
jgi:hypothetical protein